MPLVLLFVMIGMIFLGWMLSDANPAPISFAVGWSGQRVLVSATVLEIIAWSVVTGAVAMFLLNLRSYLLVHRERRRAEQDAANLRTDNSHLRRDAENARSDARLLEARLAESAERYAALEAEARPLIAMKQELAAAVEQTLKPTTQGTQRPQPQPKLKGKAKTPHSRWRRR